MKFDGAVLRDILVRHADQRGSLLPILHDVQDAFGCVPSEAVPLIAEALNCSRAEVHGPISFYHDFRRLPASKPVIKLCRAEACQARGAEKLVSLFEVDERVEVQTVYCLGLCASGPNAMLGDEPYARLDQSKARQLLDQAAKR